MNKRFNAHRNLINVAVMAGGCALFFCQAALSQQLEEVVVTAQKRSQNLQEVPLTISTFSSDKIDEYGVTNIQSLATVTPGLVVASTQGSPSPYIRGVGTRLASTGLGPSVPVYIDERYVGGGAGAVLEAPDVERVEVLKGPQGTLYGRNSIGGALRIILKDPGDEWETTLEGTVGSYNQRDVEGIVGGPVSDNVRVQVAGAWYQRDGYADNLSSEGNSEYDDRDYQMLRSRIIWDISKQTSLKWTGAWLERDDTAGFRQNSLDMAPSNIGLTFGGVTGSDGGEVAHNIPGNSESTLYSHDIVLDVALKNMDFMSVTTYADIDSDGPFENDGGSLNWLGGYIAGEEQTFSQEFRLTSKFEGDWQWVVGVEYYDTDAESLTTGTSIGFPPGVIGELGTQSVETDSFAVLGKLNYSISDDWIVSVGARYTDEEKKQNTVSNPGYLNLTGGPLPFASSASWTELTPTLNIQRFLDFGMLYFTYSQGFKSGGFNTPTNTKFDGEERPILDPEILDNHEAGFKGEFFGGLLRLNGAVYHYDYTDLQVTRAAGDGDTPVLVTQNAADAEVWGLDVDFSWAATESLIVNGGFNALDTEYKDYDASAKVPCIELGCGVAGPGTGYGDVFYDARGESLLRAPEFTAFLSARYEIQFDNGSMPLVVSYSYADEFQYDFIVSPSTAELEQDSVGLLQARISYVPDRGNWRISLWGDNLTDEEYYTEKIANENSLRVNYQPPRTYGLDVRYDF